MMDHKVGGMMILHDDPTIKSFKQEFEMTEIFYAQQVADQYPWAQIKFQKSFLPNYQKLFPLNPRWGVGGIHHIKIIPIHIINLAGFLKTMVTFGAGKW